MSPEILKHLETSDKDRDIFWENKFFNLLSMSSLEVINETPQNGPDGWPYLLTKTCLSASEPFQRILHWAAERGIGIVINPDKDFPDYVFTFGMLWYFRSTGLFYAHSGNNVGNGEFNIELKSRSQIGAPSDSYLPLSVRKIIKQFFLDQGILRPRIAAISEDGKNFDLAFSLESLGNPKKDEHLGIGEAIGWFLPPHYSIALISEKGLPDFGDL